MSKIKNSGLDQYGAKPFEQQQFGTGGVEGVKNKIAFQPKADHRRMCVLVKLTWPFLLWPWPSGDELDYKLDPDILIMYRQSKWSF